MEVIAMNLIYEHMANPLRVVYDIRITSPHVLDMMNRFPDAERFIRHWTGLRDKALQLASALSKVPRFHELCQPKRPSPPTMLVTGEFCL